MSNLPNHKIHISKEEINELPLRAFEGEVVVIHDPARLPSVFAEVHEHEVVGFDTETRPTFRKGQFHKVALVQIALDHKVFLIRINHTGLTPHLIGFLQTPQITKAGVALHDDLRGLQKLAPFEPSGFVDLSTWARQKGLQVEGVKRLTGLILGFRVSKSAQTSNWEAYELTEKQIVYAATDAWVCRELYKKMAKSF